MPETMYQIENHLINLYSLLDDNVSRNVFWARMRFDADHTWRNALDLFEQSINRKGLINDILSKFHENIREIKTHGKKLALYGAGGDSDFYASVFADSNETFDVFCDKNKCGQIVSGHKVISPDELIENKHDFFVIITTRVYLDEIKDFLISRGFPEENIIPNLNQLLEAYVLINNSLPRQYFEFPELFRYGTAFVDGGCFDGADSLTFREIYAGKYSKIFAFEPDPENYIRCDKAMSTGGGTNKPDWRRTRRNIKNSYVYAKARWWKLYGRYRCRTFISHTAF